MDIKELRLKAGISQESLAAATGVSRISIVRYENGERIPSLDVAARIAKVLDCKTDDLLKEV